MKEAGSSASADALASSGNTDRWAGGGTRKTENVDSEVGPCGGLLILPSDCRLALFYDGFVFSVKKEGGQLRMKMERETLGG